MNRTIKFRAWNKDRELMSNSDESFAVKFDGTLVVIDPIMGKYVLYPKSLYILMQYTGLKDKNGVEIYEGDIFGKIYALRCVVEQKSDGQWVCVFLDPRIETKPITDKVVLESSIEGNIHENPELLKEVEV